MVVYGFKEYFSSARQVDNYLDSDCSIMMLPRNDTRFFIVSSIDKISLVGTVSGP